MTAEQLAAIAERRAAIADYYRAGHTMAECGRQFHLTAERINQILTREGVTTRPRGPRPKKGGRPDR